MYIQVKGKELRDIFTDFVGNQKVMFNFETDGSKLHIQILEDYTACITLDCVSLDGDTNKVEVSFWATKIVHALTTEDINILIHESHIEIEQGMFKTNFLREYEAKRMFDRVSDADLIDLNGGIIKSIMHGNSKCIGLAKELSIAPPDPVFSGGMFYTDYMQTYFIDEVDFPECCISYNMLKDVAYKLDASNKFIYFKDKDVIYIRTKKYEFWIPTLNYNIDSSVIRVLKGNIDSMKKIGTINIKGFGERLEVVSNAFPKQKMELALGDSGFLLYANSNEARISLGNLSRVHDCIATISSEQLKTIARLFGDLDEFDIYKGGNYICLKTGSRILMILSLLS